MKQRGDFGKLSVDGNIIGGFYSWEVEAELRRRIKGNESLFRLAKRKISTNDWWINDYTHICVVDLYKVHGDKPIFMAQFDVSLWLKSDYEIGKRITTKTLEMEVIGDRYSGQRD